eukprot:289512-Alexandrium_andersonii.AAC.1
MKGPPLRTINNCGRVFRELWKDGAVDHIRPSTSNPAVLTDTLQACSVDKVRDLFAKGATMRDMFRD